MAKTELFEFIGDPGERKNLEKTYGSTALQMFSRLQPYQIKGKKLEIEIKPGELADSDLQEKLRALGYIH